MECWSVRTRISAYLDNAVSEQDRGEMRQHMSNCNACTRERERHERKLGEALQGGIDEADGGSVAPMQIFEDERDRARLALGEHEVFECAPHVYDVVRTNIPGAD